MAQCRWPNCNARAIPGKVYCGNHIQGRGRRIEKLKTWVATILYKLGFRPCCSTFIDGQITYGYGKLGSLGNWEYQIPGDMMKKYLQF